MINTQNLLLRIHLIGAWEQDTQTKLLQRKGTFMRYSLIIVSLERASLSGTRSQDVSYLELEGCFEAPRREILDGVIQQYFLHAHPLFPLFDEAIFWDAYDQLGERVTSS